VTTMQSFFLGAAWGFEVALLLGVIALRWIDERPSASFGIKRRARRVGCLFGQHRYKMGVAAKGGGGFGCQWCGKPSSQMSNATDPLLTDAERQVRNLFGGKW